MVFVLFFLSLVFSRDIVVEYYRTPVDSPHPLRTICDPAELEGIYYFKRKTCNCFISKILEYYSGDCYMMNFISHDVLRTDVFLSTNQNCSHATNLKYGFDVLIVSEVKDNCTHSFTPSHDKHISAIKDLDSFFAKYPIDHTDYIKKYYSKRNCEGEIIEVVIDREEAQDHEDCPKKECINTLCGGSILIECIKKEEPPIIEIMEEEITLPWVWGVLIFIGIVQLAFWGCWVNGAVYFSLRSLCSYIDQQRRMDLPDIVNFPQYPPPRRKSNRMNNSSFSSGDDGTTTSTLFTTTSEETSDFSTFFPMQEQHDLMNLQSMYPREYYKEVYRAENGQYYTISPQLRKLHEIHRRTMAASMSLPKKRKKKKRRRRFSAPLDTTTSTEVSTFSSDSAKKSMKFYSKKRRKKSKKSTTTGNKEEPENEEERSDASLSTSSLLQEDISSDFYKSSGTTESSSLAAVTSKTASSGITTSTVSEGVEQSSSDSTLMLEVLEVEGFQEDESSSDSSSATTSSGQTTSSRNSEDESSFWDGTD